MTGTYASVSLIEEGIVPVLGGFHEEGILRVLEIKVYLRTAKGTGDVIAKPILQIMLAPYISSWGLQWLFQESERGAYLYAGSVEVVRGMARQDHLDILRGVVT